jgi:hypothetical protein
MPQVAKIIDVEMADETLPEGLKLPQDLGSPTYCSEPRRERCRH